ncbi:MAG: bacillithiol biosynthesis cysteine-adding enzyme BshC [Bacteroidota bacterium]|nr:bacillithiol biosynthesis cysteine-adding enzyme BshC [Bacteroidota bacterium]
MGHTLKLNLSETKRFSGIFLDYINRNSTLSQFYNIYPDLDGISEAITKRKFDSYHRNVLVQSLHEQYADIQISESVKSNIESLNSSNTFTVTTGHQLCLFTGPLYFIYKIVTTINLTKKLNEEYPKLNFVPVYWMASEDHDVAEINHFYLFNKKIEWITEQTGPVGIFNLEGFQHVFDQIRDKLPLFEQAYLQNKSLSEATRFLVNALFAEYGLVILDPNTKVLKQLFVQNFKDDLINNIAFNKVSDTNQKLSELGYQPQLHVRAINIFYMKEGLRERIEWNNGKYIVINTNISFSKEDLLNELDSNPEFFSPNAVLRPMYQETILPNIAYVGGPAEIAYWLQLKSFFDVSDVYFPVLVPRNFALYINHSQNEKLLKLGISINELFEDDLFIKERFFTLCNMNDFSLQTNGNELIHVFEQIKSKAVVIDKTLADFVDAEKSDALKSIEKIEKRLKKALEMREEQQLNQLFNIKHRLFPDNGLQERHDNFLNIYLHKPNFIATLLQIFDPLEFKFVIYFDEN